MALWELGYRATNREELLEIYRGLTPDEIEWVGGRLATGDPWWAEWPDTPRILHGVPNRVSAISALGNAVVWRQSLPFWLAIAQHRLGLGLGQAGTGGGGVRGR